VFNQMYSNGRYNILRDLQPGERAEVHLICHNPHAKELFEWHPKRAQFEIFDHGYWHGAEENKRKRTELGLPAGQPPHPVKDCMVDFWPDPKEWAGPPSLPHGATEGDFAGAKSERGRRLAIEELFPKEQGFTQVTSIEEFKVVVIAACAGEPSRDLPDKFVELMCGELMREGFLPVFVGKNYPRFERREKHFGTGVDLIDRLTVPATAVLLQRACGLVTCHSALNILGWHLHKPQFLLYPKEVYERHIRRKDEWSFGIGRKETVHARFGDERMEMVSRFIGLLKTEAALVEEGAPFR
jgi:hypothetical protein